MADSIDAFLRLLDEGKVAVGQTLVDWIATDTDELDPDEIDEILDSADDASEYDVERLRTDAAKDRDLLLSFAAEAATVTRAEDPNLKVLVDELADIAHQAATEGIGEQDVRDRRKVLIFTYFTDTVDWIRKHLIQTAQSRPATGVLLRTHCLVGRGKGSGQQGIGAMGFRPDNHGCT